MADDKLNTGLGEKKILEAPESVTAGQPQAPAPEQAAAPTPQQEQAGPAKPDPGDVVVSFEQINELMGEKRKAARAEVEKAGDAPAKEQAPGEAEQPTAGEQKKPRRGRSPKEDKAEPAGKEAAKPRKGRPPKADKAAPGKAQPSKRDKVSRSDGKTPDAQTPPKAGKTAPEKEPAATEEPAEPTVTLGEGFSEEGNLVTRDLLYDEHTNKRFITVQARGGATFYLVIDYDKPVDEEGEQ